MFTKGEWERVANREGGSKMIGRRKGEEAGRGEQESWRSIRKGICVEKKGEREDGKRRAKEK